VAKQTHFGFVEQIIEHESVILHQLLTTLPQVLLHQLLSKLLQVPLHQLHITLPQVLLH
jgi:hypothetical protein